MIDKPGIYDLSSDDYHGDPAPEPSLTRSKAFKLIPPGCPAKAMMADEADTGRTRLGCVAHRILLGKGKEYAESPYEAYQSKKAKAWVEETVAEGLTPIKSKDLDIARTMADRVHEQIGDHEIGNIFVDPGNAEVTLLWQEHDIWCRAMVDWLPDPAYAMVDYKTSESADEDSFLRVCYSKGYAIQSVWYPRGLAILTKSDPVPFKFLVQEVNPPYLINVIELSGEGLFLAEEQVEHAIKIWRQCVKSRKWPGYGAKTKMIDPPGWAIARWEAQKQIMQLENVA